MAAAPFHFVCLDSKTGNVLTEPHVEQLLHKWSMKGHLKIQRYSFTEAFQVYQKQELADAFFKDPNVLKSLQVFPDGHAPSVGLGSLGRQVAQVAVQRVPCTLTSTALFRRLARVGVVRGEDIITPCAETYVDDIVINDCLRRILLDEDDENWEIFDHGERSEFLFILLRLLVVGGRWCQYEDRITPYVDTARAIYKDLISVEKSPEGALIVRSIVLKVVAKDSDGEAIIPQSPDHMQEVLFLCIDPVRRIINVLSHHFGENLME